VCRPSRQVGELLRDWRRINVAFTRAKAKLVIVGSRSTLAADPLLGRFLALMATSAWVVDLPPNVDSQHSQLSVARDIKPEVIDPPPVRKSASTPTPQEADMPLALTTPPPAPRKRASVKEEAVDGLRDENLLLCGRTTPTKPRVPKKARLSEEAIVKGRPLLRDVLNEYL
jgi:DNA replication ATP-dependent helicase Dna2